jgi:hypothetical protein
VLFLEAFVYYVEKKCHGQFIYDFPVKLLVVSSIFVCAVLLVIIIRKVPVLKLVLLGEKY